MGVGHNLSTDLVTIGHNLVVKKVGVGHYFFRLICDNKNVLWRGRHVCGHCSSCSAYFGTSHVDGDDETGWYRRTENNGWRPVTVKVLAEADNDPITKVSHALFHDF